MNYYTNNAIERSGNRVMAELGNISIHNLRTPDTKKTNERTQTMSFEESYKTFLIEYAYVKGLKQGSIKNYDMMRRSFLKVVGNKKIKDIDKADLLRWRQYHDARGVSPRVLRSYLRMYRLMIKTICNPSYLSLRPEEIILPRVPESRSKTITMEEAMEVYKACKLIRDRLVVYLMFTTGIRINELCNIKTSDIQDNKILIRKGKGGKERIVYIDKTCSLILMGHLESKEKSEWLFPSRQKPGEHIQTFACRLIIKKAAKRAGIAKTVNPHSFRHLFATTMLKNGADIRYVQLLMGHSDIHTTALYTKVTEEELGKKFEKFRPEFNYLNDKVINGKKIPLAT